MLAVVSPAKSLDFTSPWQAPRTTQPVMLDEAAPLVEILRNLSPEQIASLMSLSDKLAALNTARYAQWAPTHDSQTARPAVLAFQGDVYKGLRADTLSPSDLNYAQDHLAILSGLYGLLRPLDLIQPYRLEMGTALPNSRGKDLYAYWKALVTAALRERLQTSAQPHLINLASQEYFRAVDTCSLQAPVLHVEFKDLKNGQYKIISFYAKKARGLMARYLIRERLDRIEGLRDFTDGGYAFSPTHSKPDHWVFLRDRIDEDNEHAESRTDHRQ